MTLPAKVELTPQAFADIEDIRAYLIERSPKGADNVRRAIVATLERLSAHPMLGQDRPELAVRAIGVPRYRYTIYYRVVSGEVQVIHVRDDRRQPLKFGDV